MGLLDAGPQHGYALFKTIERDLQGICHIGMNRLYALLEEMEHEGLIHGRAGASTNGPARVTYHLTAKGRRTLDNWLATPCPTMREMRVDFPPKLFLVQRRGTAATNQLIDMQREACQHELERMTAQRHVVRASSDFLPMIYAFRVGQIKAGIAWLDQCKRAGEHAAVPA